MYENNPSDILRKSIRAYNNEFVEPFGEKYTFQLDFNNLVSDFNSKTAFDEVSSCIIVDPKLGVVERNADVTGLYGHVTINLLLILRVKADQNLLDFGENIDIYSYMPAPFEAYDLINSIYADYLSVLKSTTFDNAYIVRVDTIKEAGLSARYDNSVEDYTIKFTVTYERRK